MLPNFSDIRKMISQYENVELNQKMLDLQTRMLEIVEENQSLKEENKCLKKKIDVEHKMTFRAPFWYMEGDEQPYCPSCKESKDILVHLIGQPKGRELRCPTCANRYEYNEPTGGWVVI